MKKIIALGLVVASMAATTAFGQGYFLFTSGKSHVYDGFTTPGAAATSANVDVAFLWAAGTPTPLVDTFLTSTPTSGNSSTTELYTVGQAWTAILNDPNFTLAIDNGSSAIAIAKTVASPAGSFSYNSGTDFAVTGTAANATYTLYQISWNSAFATPSAASAAGSAVGWSAPFSYTSVANIGTPASMSTGAFGTFVPFVASVPEPGTMALAGLGGLSLLAFRRKK